MYMFIAIIVKDVNAVCRSLIITVNMLITVLDAKTTLLFSELLLIRLYSFCYNLDKVYG